MPKTCKECNKEITTKRYKEFCSKGCYSKDYNKRNKEKNSIKRKEYYSKNKEKFKQSMIKWRSKNKDKLNKYQRKIYNLKKEKIKEIIEENKQLKEKLKEFEDAINKEIGENY